MTLRQYSINDLHVKGIPWNTDDSPSAPGQEVCHVNNVDSHGMVVAISEGYATVLWSKEPVFLIDYAGYVHAPYVPKATVPFVLKPEDFAPRKGIMTRYSKALVNPSFYGTIKVLDLKSGSK